MPALAKEAAYEKTKSDWRIELPQEEYVRYVVQIQRNQQATAEARRIMMCSQKTMLVVWFVFCLWLFGC